MILIRVFQSTWRRICPSATFFTTNFTRAGLGSNVSLCGEGPVSRNLGHSTACFVKFVLAL